MNAFDPRGPVPIQGAVHPAAGTPRRPAPGAARSALRLAPLLALVASLGAGSGDAAAAMPTTAGGAPAVRPTAALPAATSTLSTSLNAASNGRAAATSAPALQAARLAGVDAARGQVVVHGRTLALHPSARVVDATGRVLAGGAAALRPGDAVRFALEPDPTPPTGAAGDVASERRVVLIYLDAR